MVFHSELIRSVRLTNKYDLILKYRVDGHTDRVIAVTETVHIYRNDINLAVLSSQELICSLRRIIPLLLKG